MWFSKDLETGFSSIVGIHETFVMGGGLCFTNIAGGVAAGLAGYSLICTVSGMYLASFLLLEFGQVIGKQFGNVINEKYLSLVSGLVLILIGLMDIFLE